MKKIQRYTVGTADPEAIVKDNKGWLVSYDDYAALKAENERLRAGVETMEYHAPGVATTKWVRAIEYDRLQAKNELLQKTGDAMAFNYEQMAAHDGVYDSDLMKFVEAWLAAKGVQS